MRVLCGYYVVLRLLAQLPIRRVVRGRRVTPILHVEHSGRRVRRATQRAARAADVRIPPSS
jgi:hypothetical protein